MKKKLQYALAGILAICALAAVWLFRMHYVVLAFESLTTERLEAKVLPDLAWNGIYLIAGGHILDLDLPDKHATSARVEVDGDDLLLQIGAKHIPLGHRTQSIISNAETIKPASVFALQPGDRLSLSIEQSWFPWPTFFEMNFMTGNSPSWRRYGYYRLVLREASGEAVEMLWRYEEFYYPSEHDWVKGDRLCEDNEPACGLIRVRIYRRS